VIVGRGGGAGGSGAGTGTGGHVDSGPRATGREEAVKVAAARPGEGRQREQPVGTVVADDPNRAPLPVGAPAAGSVPGLSDADAAEVEMLPPHRRAVVSEYFRVMREQPIVPSAGAAGGGGAPATQPSPGGPLP
jgi:hypothetical protein